MVEKIDKPDDPSPYTVTAPTETKKDKPREERNPHEEIAKYQKRSSGKEWDKFTGEMSSVRTLQIPVEEIKQLLLRRLLTRQGNPAIEAKLIWQNGSVTDAVNFLLKKREDFLKIKSLPIDAPIPEYFWKSERYLEVSIPQRPSTSGSWSYREMEKSDSQSKKTLPGRCQKWGKWLGMIDEKTLKPQYGIMAAYAGLLLGLVLLVISLFGGF